MTSPTTEIKEKLDIVEVVGSYLKLEKAGQNYKAKCPFHNEKTPSFFVSPKRNSYYCFGCGAKGDIFSFVQQFENIDFIGALKMLADRAGIKLKFESREKRDEKERIFDCIDTASKIFEGNLENKKDALDYLKKRGLTETTITNWRIGFAHDEWHEIEEKLSAHGFKKEEMLKVGVIKNNENGKIYDTFRNRIIFPIFDNAKRIIAFSGRYFGQEEGVAKYLNSPETEIFKKSDILYGLHIAKNSIRKLGFVILVEGQMDLLMSQQSGWENTVASSGTALTPNHLAILKRLTSNIVIAYDSDKAGVKASLRAFELALAFGFNVKAVKTSENKDPADLILKDKNLWKSAIKEAVHIVDYIWQDILKQNLPKEKLVNRLRTSIYPLLYSIPTDGEKMRLISSLQMAMYTGLREEHILEEVKKIVPIETKSQEATTFSEKIPPNTAIRKLFGIIFAVEEKNSTYKEFEKLKKQLENILEDKYLELRKIYEKEKDRLIFEIESAYGFVPIEEKEIEELFKNVEDDVLRENLSEKMKLLKIAESKKDNELVKKILAQCQKIALKIEQIKKQ